MTFLEIVANDIHTRFDGQYDDVTIIFPNKRARLFFNQYIASLAGNPIWTPQYSTISEIFASLSDLTIADRIQLVCMLYRSYIKITGKDASIETLDKFYSWGEIMLNDFQDIDNNMAQADKLFKNIEELADLTDLSYLSDNQREAIYQFFENFSIDIEKSMLKKKFLSLWNYLYDIYIDFRQTLQANGFAYEGMLKRNVIEGLMAEDDRYRERAESSLRRRKYVVVGFNILNETERALFVYLREHYDILFYWDYDEAYTGNLASGNDKTMYEAGQFIQQNIRIFGNALDADTLHVRGLDEQSFNNFRKPKQINFIAAPTENAQTRYIDRWIRSGNRLAKPYRQTAIVLCNEALLPSVLHSIPEQVPGTDETMSLNITMGYPMMSTPICSYIAALIDMQTAGQTGNGTWRYRYVAQVLDHPYTHRMAKDDAISIHISLKQNNMKFPEEELFTSSSNAFIQTLFTQHHSNRDILSYLAEIIKRIGNSYKDEMLLCKQGQHDEKYNESQLYVESIFNANLIINRLLSIQDTGLLNVNQHTLSRLVKQLLQDKAIPFHGEPIIGLQIMGLLETRNLDFKHVIMLSVTDDNLPKSADRSSLIPYNLRNAYGMSTLEKQISLYAYYFYRLIQRAEDVTIMYNNSTNDLAKGEMSRFMMQLLIDNDKLFAKGQKISTTVLTADHEMIKPMEYVAKKTPEVMKRLYSIYCPQLLEGDNAGKQSKLSPSAINMYIDCPLAFYFKYVANFNEQDEVMEEVDNAIFGTIFHDSMQAIYEYLMQHKNGSEITKQDIIAITNQEHKNSKSSLIRQVVDKAFARDFFKNENKTPMYNGEQLINRQVIITYVKNQLLYDAELCPMTINYMEKGHYTTLTIPKDTTTPSLPSDLQIMIGGIIDRCDTVTIDGNKVTRIVDYKTSAKAQKAASLDKLFINSANRPYHILQALYYSYVVTQNDDVCIAPALMYVKARSSCEPIIKIDKKQIDDFRDISDEYKELLTETVAEIFDPLVDFKQSCTDKKCGYCSFNNLCRREVIKFD